jgi:predicted negative regulator of RcsB-dependent stress response
MAALDLQEQEQLDALKAWWHDNRTWLLGSLLVGALIAGGWRGWHYYQHKQANESALLYAEFVNQVENKGDLKQVNDAAAAVMEKYASSAYAPRAALLAAQLNEENKDAVHAKTQLQWVLDHAREDGLKEVARLRLATLLLDEKNYDAATKLLDAKHTASFDALYADLKGDVFNAQGKKDEARTAYKLAYEKTGDDGGSYRSLIQLKMDALGTAAK